jgi:hypothetical protein
VSTAKVADGAVTGTKIANGTVALANLSTVSGDATVDPDPLAAQSCAIVEANAAAIRANDRPIFQVPAGLENGLTAEAMTADTDGKLRFRLCNVTNAGIDSVSLSYGYLVLR